jgi:hypothetical protein
MFLDRLASQYKEGSLLVPSLNPRYRGEIIAHDKDGTTFSMQFYTKSELTIGGQNRIDEVENAAAKTSTGSKLLDVQRTAGMAGSLISGSNQAINVAQTETTWQGANKPTFQIDVSLICLKAGDPRYDVTKMVAKFMRLVYPDISPSGFMRPPLGYTSSIVGKFSNNGEKGKVSLKLGNWFFARKLIVETCNFTFSKVLNRDGKPLYAEGSITLIPYRLISYKEFLEYFGM